MTSVSDRPLCRYTGIAFTTGSVLLLQIYLTRVFTVLFHSSFAFLAISIAFLGLGSAGVFAYLFPGLFPPEKRARRVAVLGLVCAAFSGGAFCLLVTIDNAVMARYLEAAPPLTVYVLRVFVAGALMVPAFFCAGLVLSLMFQHHVARINRLYFADLLGAGLGCLAVLPLLNLVGGDDAVFVIAALAAGGGTFLALAARARRVVLAGGTLMAVCLLLGLCNSTLGLVQIRSHTTNTGGAGVQRCPDKAVKNDREIFHAWNSFSRIGVFETVGGHELYVRIDSSCQTSIPIRDHDDLAWHTDELTFERLPFLLDRHRRYLEIGAGGGSGMLIAHHHGSTRITGVEINDITVDCATRIFAERCGMNRLFDEPGVELVVDEGRSYVSHMDELYDTITITFIQTGAATGTTAFALSEANLFTVEAFTSFLSKLDPENGLFYVYRHGGNQMLRLISIMREAMRRRGITDLKPRVFIVKDPLLNHAVLMVSLRPFSVEEIHKLEDGSRRLSLKVLYSPGTWNQDRRPNPLVEELRDLRREGRDSWANITTVYNRQHGDDSVLPIEHVYLTADDPDAFADDYFLDIRATTDDRPYFFFFSVNRWADLGKTFQPAGLEFVGSIVVLLFWLLVLFTVLVLLLIVLPLFWKRRGALAGRGTGAFLCYFGLLGVSYISIEVSFIQRFVLFLGHPIYAVSVVLMAFLLCTGVGSFFSDFLVKKGWLTLPRTLLILAVLLVAYNQLLPAVFRSGLIGVAVPGKIAITFVLILPLAFLMGILFPQGMRRIEQVDPGLVPWVWGANSATSVVGSIVSLILAIHFGFSLVLYFGVGLYVLSWLLMWHPAWRRREA